MNQTDQWPTIDGLSISESLNVIALSIDRASDGGDIPLLMHCISLADQLESRGLHPEDASLTDYYRSNAWAGCYQPRHRDHDDAWSFEQPELQKQIFFLRRSANSPGFSGLSTIRRCQILTNTGNALETLGRFVEARSHWTAALNIDPHFWMARANRGRALMFYANSLYDHGHSEIFSIYAYRDLIKASEDILVHPELGDRKLYCVLSEMAKQIKHSFNIDAIEKDLRLDGWYMGQDEAECSYRQWCLENVLFLNPLNDVENSSIAARDVMGLPDFTLAIDEPPSVIGMFNELKQGFASARWLLWEGITSDETHFSDRQVLLYDTLDYPSYGLAIEKTKIAFRLLYSTFDKIAFLLNHYFSLRIPDNQVYFKGIWHDRKRSTIRPEMAASENWPLRGLYWISKDLFVKNEESFMEPSAAELKHLRDHLEHKYVKISENAMVFASATDPFYDPLAYAISRHDLEERTLRLLKLIRSALIYLSLAMHREETRREQARQELSISIPLEPLRNE